MKDKSVCNLCGLLPLYISGPLKTAGWFCRNDVLQVSVTLVRLVRLVQRTSSFI